MGFLRNRPVTSIKNKKECRGIQVANVLNQYKFNLDTCFSAGETLKIFSSVVFFHTTAWNEKQQQQNVIAERGFDPQTSELLPSTLPLHAALC